MGLMDFFGAAAHGVNAAHAESERLADIAIAKSKALREQAGKQLEYSQKLGDRALENNDPAAAYEALKGVPQSEVDAGLTSTPRALPQWAGVTTTSTVAAPSMGNAPTPEDFAKATGLAAGAPSRFGIKMPSVGDQMPASLGAPAALDIQTTDTTRPDFKNPADLARLRGLGGLGRAADRKPLTLSGGETALDPVTYKPIYTAPYTMKPWEMTGEQKLGLAHDKAEAAAKSADDKRAHDVARDATRFAYQKEIAALRAAGVKGKTPANLGPVKVRFKETFIKNRASMFAKYRPGGIGEPAVKVPPTPDDVAKWSAEADAAWETENPSTPAGTATPGGNPTGPYARKVSAIPPPVKYEDTALLPAFEAFAKEAVALAPGTTISSRARSATRNAKAKPGGGAPDSWHMHRQAFDIMDHTPAQAQALRAWANQRGLYMIDEGNHLHFQPVQGVSADEAPQVASFYSKYGISEA